MTTYTPTAYPKRAMFGSYIYAWMHGTSVYDICRRFILNSICPRLKYLRKLQEVELYIISAQVAQIGPFLFGLLHRGIAHIVLNTSLGVWLFKQTRSQKALGGKITISRLGLPLNSIDKGAFLAAFYFDKSSPACVRKDTAILQSSPAAPACQLRSRVEHEQMLLTATTKNQKKASFFFALFCISEGLFLYNYNVQASCYVCIIMYISFIESKAAAIFFRTFWEESPMNFTCIKRFPATNHSS